MKVLKVLERHKELTPKNRLNWWTISVMLMLSPRKITCLFIIYSKDVLIFLYTMTIKSQTIRKLKPMKSPRSPPQSATKDRCVYAQTSFLMLTFGLPNLNQILVELVFLKLNAIGGSITFSTNIIFQYKTHLFTLYSI